MERSVSLEVDRGKLYRYLRYGTLALLIPSFGLSWPERYLATLKYTLTDDTPSGACGPSVTEKLLARYEKFREG